MAHLLEQMAYVGAVPWHGLGQQLTEHQPLDVWREQAGMNWRIEEAPVCFADQAEYPFGELYSYPEQKVLYRSDTKAPLSVVSNRYKVVQPEEILEFYRDLTEYAGYQLETAGVLKGGRKLWALARSGLSSSIHGQDEVNGYLLLATSCDGTLATMATPTTVRVVCNNTLQIATNGASQAVKVPHRSQFDAQAVKTQLGISVSQWGDFMYRMKTLAERKLTHREINHYLQTVVCGVETPVDDLTELPNFRALGKVQRLYLGAGRGSTLSTAQGTAWGLLNAVTQYVDHDKQARNTDSRLDSAWFGQGARLKQQALHSALELVS